MSPDPSWDPPRWKSDHIQKHSELKARPPLSAPTAVNPATQSAILDPYVNSWSAKSGAEVDAQRGMSRGLPALSMSEIHSSTHQVSQSHISARGGDSLTARSASSAAYQTSPWQSLPSDQDRPAANERRLPEAPLTLHIPNKNQQEHPRISTSIEGNQHAGSAIHTAHHAQSQPQTSLPSFAKFQETTSRSEDGDEVEHSQMSSRLSCHSCTKLQPLISEVAARVAEFDDNLQSYYNSRPVTRTFDAPQDSPVRAIQWILSRLRSAKCDLDDISRRQQPGNYSQQYPPTFSGGPSRNASPPSSLKRGPERWDEPLTSKRPRSGDSPVDLNRSGSMMKDDRRPSVDFSFSQGESLPRPGYSPPPSESVPGSAYPRAGSPGLSMRRARTLPSPSSMAGPSATPSLAQPGAQSIGSPTTSYHPGGSIIHTASTNSATTAHMADLQHQVTLKSLALQTLQSEYASLLQKLQRERVKSQTIEKKTNVADQEVNELTSRNDELVDQVKTLQKQLEESEKKRDEAQTGSSREKDQWGRMLEMSGRLQSRHAEEKQKLLEENERLKNSLASYEEVKPGSAGQHGSDVASQVEAPKNPGDSNQGGQRVRRLSDTEPSANPGSPSENDDLRRENAVLRNRVDALRRTVGEVRCDQLEFQKQMEDLLSRNGKMRSSLDKVITKDNESADKTKTMQRSRVSKATSGRSTPARQRPKWSSSPPKTTESHASGTATWPSKSQPAGTAATLPYSTASSATSSTMASVARATSPGPAELGIHITPSTSSPEELIKALGPVPAPVNLAQPAVGRGSTYKTESPVHDSSNRRDTIQRALSGGEVNQMPRTSGEPEHGERRFCSLVPFTQILSPYPVPTAHPQNQGTSPHSYHSSPGPLVDDSSPPNSGASPEDAQAGYPVHTRDEKAALPPVVATFGHHHLAPDRGRGVGHMHHQFESMRGLASTPRGQ